MPKVGISHVMEVTSLDDIGLPVCLAFGGLTPGSDLRSMMKQALQSSGMDEWDERLNQVWASLETFAIGEFEQTDRQAQMVMSAGKGLAPLDARVSAMMEAVERFSARQVSGPTRWASYRQISQGEAALDPRQLLLIAPADYSDEQVLKWTVGRDLRSGQELWVPVEAATFNGAIQATGRTFVDTPTGLGAGNVLVEAICHGLAEAIEHDAWALAVANQALERAEYGLFARLGIDHGELQPENIQVPFRQLESDALEHLGEFNGWIKQMQSNRAWYRFHDITSDVGVAVISASLAGMWDGRGEGPQGGGLGAHPDARVALARALSEAAQQRLLLGLQRRMRAIRPAPASQDHTTLQTPYGASDWASLAWEIAAQQASTVSFDQLHSAEYPSIEADIDFMMESLKHCGFEQVVVVDLTRNDLETPVVKVIVPGLADYWNNTAPPNWQAIQRRLRRNQK